ncbi:MAG: hypothetical protein GF313_17600, partial [Caldithrix sp.]|nr:hypothetical protein [Caldithrix sp.]
MKSKILMTLALSFLMMLLIAGCTEESDGPTDDGNKELPVQTETRTGQLKMIEGATVDPTDLQVVSFAGASDVQGDGSFSVDATMTDDYQLMMFRSKSNGNPVFLGLYDPAKQEVSASDSSTALALTLLNPYLVFADQMQKDQYLAEVMNNPKFENLLNMLNDAYMNDASDIFNYDDNPKLYQLIVQIMKESMSNLGNGYQATERALYKDGVSIGEPPYIQDASGDDIMFMNPRHVWYAAGIYPNDGNLSDVVTLGRAQTIVSYNWGWPPQISVSAQETPYTLGNGTFKIGVYKGIDLTKLNQWNDPVGRASILNTGEAILNIIRLANGYMPEPDFAKLSNHINISPANAEQLNKDLVERNTEAFLVDFCIFVASNSQSLANWAWQENQVAAAQNYLNQFTELMESVSFVFKLMGFINEEGPFYWDLLYAPP